MEFAQSAPAALQLIGDMANASLILIFSDINMPGMTGLELLPKAKSVRPDVPVIMVTESADETVLRPSDSSSTTRMRRFMLPSWCAYGDAETKRPSIGGRRRGAFYKAD